MRISEVKPEEQENKEKTTVFDIDVHNFENNSLLLDEFDLDNKTISTLESYVRNSFEYRNYIKYLKNELNLKSCSLLENINIDEIQVSLEFHHYPLNLYQICEAVSKKMIDNSVNGVSMFDISEKVVSEHYKNKIGLVPLTKTIHEMAHSQAITIPTEKIYGNYKSFIKEYLNYIDQDVLQNILSLEQSSNSKDIQDANKYKLEKNISYYNVNYNRNNNEEN